VRIFINLLRAAAFNQAIAVPVGLIIGASNGYWVASFIVATVFSQCIGAMCWLTGSLAASRVQRVAGRSRQIALWIGLYFLNGVAGAAIARQICASGFGLRLGGQAPIFSLAIGASVAVLVGVAMIVIHDLRASLESSQQALRDRELEDAKLKQAKTDAELAALQARINPHFLFNTLNSIAALIGEDPARAEEATLQLSSLFRYALQANTRSLVTVDEEMTIVRRYLEVEKLRLGDRLQYQLDVAPSLSAREIPALLLQPLVENAIKHGVAPHVGGGTVHVVGREAGPNVVFIVTDSGPGAGIDSGTGVGLENVRQRLTAMYGRGASVILTREDGKTVARVTIPR
jgi:two-component sensor histidine kinase